MIGMSSEQPSMIHNADLIRHRTGTYHFGLFLTFLAHWISFLFFSSLVLEKCQMSQNNRENIAIASITGMTKIDRIW